VRLAPNMKTLLICHHDAPLDRVLLARWLAAVSDLTGIVEIEETRAQVRRRVRRELSRVGPARFLDVLAFRLYYRLVLAQVDRAWERERLRQADARLPELPAGLPVLRTSSPNSAEAHEFVESLAPDLALARCKLLLRESLFSLPRFGTFVMHPGICPEYRNAHGCFWALAEGDRQRVGMTLLRIDRGVDTGPVYGYFTVAPDELGESHIVLQHRVVLDNLPAIGALLGRIAAGAATPIDTSGRRSRTWGQPWLTRYIRYRRVTRKRGGQEG
jgi:hypothetical protein